MRAATILIVEDDPEIRQLVAERDEVDDRRAENAPVDLQVDIGGSEAIVLGDRVALRRVVSNLVEVHGGSVEIGDAPTGGALHSYPAVISQLTAHSSRGAEPKNIFIAHFRWTE